jgi:hypothetical protein
VANKFIHNLVINFFDKNLTGSTFPQEFYRKQFPKGLYLVVVTFYIGSTSGFKYIDTHINTNPWYERSSLPAGWVKFTDMVELYQDGDIFIESYGEFNQNGDSYSITNSSVLVCCLKTFD